MPESTRLDEVSLSQLIQEIEADLDAEFRRQVVDELVLHVPEKSFGVFSIGSKYRHSLRELSLRNATVT